MRKKTIAIMTATIIAALAAGCSADKETVPEGATEQTAAATAATTAAISEEEQEPAVLNIYSVGEDFANRVRDYYPGYEAAGDDAGKIGGTQVKWHIYEDVNEYREDLDEKLSRQAGVDNQKDTSGISPEDRVDLFVVDEAYLKDYVGSAYSMDVIGDIGLTDQDLSDQFPYTQQMATDEQGRLKAVTWQATPGAFAYRRSIARKVLGTDEPEKVQEAVSDWARFAETAELAKEEGYYMLSAYGDAYQVYKDNVTSAWVEDGSIHVDPHLEEWVRQTREFTENGYIHGTEQWSDEWKADHTGDGEVFGFFYSSWGIRYTLQDKAEGITGDEEEDEENTVESAAGDYAVCRGPEPCHYGGKWIVAAAGGSNTELIRSIMLTLTCDPQTMVKIAQDIHEFTNTVSGMTAFSQTDYKVEVLGGQNPIPVYLQTAMQLSQKHTTSYDDDLDLGFQVSMQDYFTGKVSEEDAIETFRKVALNRYEELEDHPEDESEEE